MLSSIWSLKYNEDCFCRKVHFEKQASCMSKMVHHSVTEKSKRFRHWKLSLLLWKAVSSLNDTWQPLFHCSLTEQNAGLNTNHPAGSINTEINQIKWIDSWVSLYSYIEGCSQWLLSLLIDLDIFLIECLVHKSSGAYRYSVYERSPKRLRTVYIWGLG